jgi:hypothetical protein
MEHSKPKVIIDQAEYEELIKLRDDSIDNHEFDQLNFKYRLVREALTQLGNYISPATIQSFNEDPSIENTCHVAIHDGKVSVSYRDL